jgi:hypothetical protein
LNRVTPLRHVLDFFTLVDLMNRVYPQAELHIVAVGGEPVYLQRCIGLPNWDLNSGTAGQAGAPGAKNPGARPPVHNDPAAKVARCPAQ